MADDCEDRFNRLINAVQYFDNNNLVWEYDQFAAWLEEDYGVRVIEDDYEVIDAHKHLFFLIQFG